MCRAKPLDEVLMWMVNNAANPSMQEKVDRLQQEIIKVDSLIHVAYLMCAKFFLAKRGLFIRAISRAHALQLRPQQKQTLDKVHTAFLHWCDVLVIENVNVAELMQPKVLLGSPI